MSVAMDDFNFTSRKFGFATKCIGWEGPAKNCTAIFTKPI